MASVINDPITSLDPSENTKPPPVSDNGTTLTTTYSYKPTVTVNISPRGSRMAKDIAMLKEAGSKENLVNRTAIKADIMRFLPDDIGPEPIMIRDSY